MIPQFRHKFLLFVKVCVTETNGGDFNFKVWFIETDFLI